MVLIKLCPHIKCLVVNIAELNWTEEIVDELIGNKLKFDELVIEYLSEATEKLLNLCLKTSVSKLHINANFGPINKSLLKQVSRQSTLKEVALGIGCTINKVLEIFDPCYSRTLSYLLLRLCYLIDYVTFTFSSCSHR